MFIFISVICFCFINRQLLFYSLLHHPTENFKLFAILLVSCLKNLKKKR